MDDASQKVSRTIWVGVALVILLMAAALVLSKVKPHRRANTTMGTLADFAITNQIGQIAAFTLTNQSGQTVTLADLRGKVWVADIIFTRCAGPCPRMTRQMASLQAALPPQSTVRLVTLTTDPEFDTPEVLAKYAARFNANPDRWQFLTGTKKEIAGLAVDSLKLGTKDTKPEERVNENDLFIHSTYFVVVDKQARLRGVFESDAEGSAWTKVQSEILEIVHMLQNEP